MFCVKNFRCNIFIQLQICEIREITDLGKFSAIHSIHGVCPVLVYQARSSVKPDHLHHPQMVWLDRLESGLRDGLA